MLFSRTMKAHHRPEVTIISELTADWVKALKNQSGKDIWLFGRSDLFRTFLDSRYVDSIEVSVIPVLLGDDPIASASVLASKAESHQPQSLPLRKTISRLSSPTLARRIVRTEEGYVNVKRRHKRREAIR